MTARITHRSSLSVQANTAVVHSSMHDVHHVFTQAGRLWRTVGIRGGCTLESRRRMARPNNGSNPRPRMARRTMMALRIRGQAKDREPILKILKPATLRKSSRREVV